ncbi:MAG: hypothetical protein HYU69_06600 [Bacteroidetes bacterium]|nr:hypothetical protein [Bacteroidota bacterium]
MKSIKNSPELDVDFIQSKPLSKTEELALSDFIKKLKSRTKVKHLTPRKSRKRIAA